MGVSVYHKVALIFDDNDVAATVGDMIEGMDRLPCEYNNDAPVFDVETNDNVVTFNNAGYGPYDLTELRMSSREFNSFVGWVSEIYGCQGQDMHYVRDDDELDNCNDFDNSDGSITERDDYPKQEDYQTMEDDEVVDDEEAYENACEQYRDDLSDIIAGEFNERVESYCGSIDQN